jgi:putative transposase
MKFRKSVRLRNYNYASNGFYFVTICTTMRKPLLDIYKCRAEEILLSLPERFRGVQIDYYKFGKDHLHIIFIFDNADVKLSQVVRTYKALVTKTIRYKNFWEWNYYEHVIRNEKALYNIRKYIDEHSLKEEINWKEIYGGK